MDTMVQAASLYIGYTSTIMLNKPQLFQTNPGSALLYAHYTVHKDGWLPLVWYTNDQVSWLLTVL